MTAGELRQDVWVTLMRERAVAYPYPPFGHHPNFKGAAVAAIHLLDHLLKTSLKPGQTVLSYPDYVLKPLRKGLLEAGVNVTVPAKYGKGFRFLEAVSVKPSRASSIAGAEKEGILLENVERLPVLSFAFIACVALDKTGQILTKGYGFKLPEGLELPRATIVHDLQVRELSDADEKVSVYALPRGVSQTRG